MRVACAQNHKPPLAVVHSHAGHPSACVSVSPPLFSCLPLKPHLRPWQYPSAAEMEKRWVRPLRPASALTVSCTVLRHLAAQSRLLPGR